MTAATLPKDILTPRPEALVHFKNNNPENPMYEELFDRQNDPHEVYNLVGDGEYGMLKGELTNRMEKLIEAAQ